MAMATDVKTMDLSTADSHDHKLNLEKLSSNRVATEDCNSASFDLCLICQRSQNVSRAKQLISEYFNWSRDDGVEGDILSCLDSNLLSVFVLRKVINYPESECVKIFETTLGVVNPADWFVLCESCLELINQVYQLEKQLEELKRKVRKQLNISFAKNEKHKHGGVSAGLGGVLNIQEMIRKFLNDEKLKEAEVPTPKFPAAVSVLQKRQSRPRKSKTPVTPTPLPNKPKTSFTSDSIKKRGRGRPKKSKLKLVEITIKKEICDETEEPQMEQIDFDIADQDEAPWSPPNTGSDIDKTDSDPEEAEYRPPKSAKLAIKPSKKHLYTCKQCKKTYRYLMHYRRHVHSHKNKKAPDPPRPKANVPPAPLSNEQLMEAINSHRRTYRCSDCPQVFLSSRQEYMHRAAVHGAAAAFPCEHCPKRFFTPSCLQKHILINHQVQPYPCDHCGKMLRSRLAYLPHFKNKHDDPNGQFRCEKCGVKMSTEDALTSHRKFHAKKSVRKPKAARQPVTFMYTCDQCGIQYQKLTSYLKHLQAHKDGQIFYKVKPTLADSSTKLEADDSNAPIINHDEIANLVAFSKLTKKIPMRCDICFRTYIKPDELLEHIQTEHTSDTLYTCKACDHTFTSLIPWIIHMYIHDASKHQVCCECQAKFRNRENLLEHFTQAHGIPTSATCVHCQEQFSDLYVHQTHLHTAHNESNTFLCSVCDESFTRKNIMRHLCRNHAHQSREYKCPDCSEVFDTAVKLLEHRILVHGASSSFKCAICFKYYSTKAGLRGHVYQAHGYREIPYRCQICDKVFSTTTNYNQHIRAAHEEKSFTCEVCGFMTTSERALSRHMFTHAKKHVCAHCGRRFSRQSCLKDHMAVHTGEVVVCEECGHTFQARRYLHRHIKRFHTGDNPPPVQPQKFLKKPRSWIDKDEGKRYYGVRIPPPDESVGGDDQK